MSRHARALITATALGALVSTSCATAPKLERDRIIHATVRVRADGCGPRTELGVGTTVDGGLVVTAAHVVAGSEHVEIVDSDGVAAAADVVFFDPDLDVAVLAPVGGARTGVALRDAPVDVGDRGVLGLPAPDDSVELVDVEVLQRATIRTTDIYGDAAVLRAGSRLAVSVEPGDSGAMVHLPGGGAGIVWSRSVDTAGQAWTVDLPPELLDASGRRGLTEAVDTGRCP